MSTPPIVFRPGFAPGAIEVIVDGVFVARASWQSGKRQWLFHPYSDAFRSVGIVSPEPFYTNTVAEMRVDIREAVAKARRV